MNKVIVVTGGTKGIGKAVIEKFAAQNFDIITCSRHIDGLVDLQEEIQQKYSGTQLHFTKADLSEKEQVISFINFIKYLEKPIEVLVNNAGIFLPGQIHTEDEGVLEKTMELNVYSIYHLTRGLIHDMKAQRSGHIFNLCSTASITPYTNGGSYCISKYALLGFSKVLREEMKEFGIKVTSVLPGATLTASWEGSDLPPERFMKAEDVAHIIYNSYTLSQQAVVEEVLIRPQLGDIK
ncbi:SDR family oxidoreductase [soil metagenome]